MAGAGIHPYHQQWAPAAPVPPPPPPPVAGAAVAAAPPPPILVDNPNRPATDEVSSIQLSQSNLLSEYFDFLDIRGQDPLFILFFNFSSVKNNFFLGFSVTKQRKYITY